jgi:hypothetical protein
MSKWLVISNCQTQGLARSLGLQAPGIEVHECDILTYRREHDLWSARLGDYAKLVVNSQFYESDVQPDAGGLDTLVFPQMYFPGYHPDETLLYLDGAVIDSSIGAYHSLIACSAYLRGRSVAETCALYRLETYSALDYLGWWSRWRLWFLNVFAEYDFDLTAAFNRWSRGRAFMYTSHHPRVECLFDIAGLILNKCGVEAQRPNCLPQDLLVTDVCFPVYSEIATGLGFEGSYQFKLRGQDRCIDLGTFVSQSFAIYDAHDLTKAKVEDNRQELFEALASL